MRETILHSTLCLWILVQVVNAVVPGANDAAFCSSLLSGGWFGAATPQRRWKTPSSFTLLREGSTIVRLRRPHPHSRPGNLIISNGGSTPAGALLGATSRRETLRTILETTIAATPAVLLAPLLSSTFPASVSAATTTDDNDNDGEAPKQQQEQQQQMEETVVLRGRVTVAPDVQWEPLLATSSSSSPPAAALYITCRPDKPDNVPAAILNGSRGKPPPVLSARLPNVSHFPLDFELVIPRDLTLEGGWDGHQTPPSPLPSGTFAAAVPTMIPPTIPLPTRLDELWWNKSDLIVSARWDNDGIAATRSPDDLVGRGLWKFRSQEQPGNLGNGGKDKESASASSAVLEIQLTGRGAFGKFATAGNSKK